MILSELVFDTESFEAELREASHLGRAKPTATATLEIFAIPWSTIASLSQGMLWRSGRVRIRPVKSGLQGLLAANLETEAIHLHLVTTSSKPSTFSFINQTIEDANSIS